MHILRIEHHVANYAAWKALFDSDPADRRGSGVRRYRLNRGAAEPNDVSLDLDFDDAESAEAMLERLRGVWAGPGASAVSNPVGTIFEVAESAEL